MTDIKTSSMARLLMPFLPSLLAAFLVFLGLGDFGLWEPHETRRIDLGIKVGAAAPCPTDDEDGDCVSDRADKCPMEPETHNGKLDDDGCPDDPPGTGVLMDERIAALGWKATSARGFSARAPFALLALLAVLAVQLTLLAVSNRRISMIAGFILAGAPVFLFNGRQITGHGFFMFGETLAICGLFLSAYGSSVRLSAIGLAVGGVGMLCGFLASGALLGIGVPAAVIIVTCALNGDVARLFKSEARVPGQRRLTMLVTTILSLAAVAAFLFTTLSGSADVPLLTGGLAQKPPSVTHATVALESLAYGWFPWSALVPAIIFGMLGQSSIDDERFHLKALVVSGVSIGLLVYTLYYSVHGDSPVFLALPMALGGALVLEGFEVSERPRRMAGLLVIVLLALMLKDFVQDPTKILTGYALGGIKTSDDFAPIFPAAVASIPFLLMVLIASFAGTRENPARGWRAIRARALLPIAAVAVGAYVTAVLVPQLSINMSSKHVIESYERFAADGDPLAVMGKARVSVEATRLETRKEVIDWLARDDRVFALVPPSELAGLDRDYRAVNGSHLFVLDAKSEKLILTTNREVEGTKNLNPIVKYVSSSMFKPGPKNKKEVNFNDNVTLLGWEVTSETGANHFEKGKEFTLTTYWRCDSKISTKYQVFVHIDGAGPRIHGDHDPVQGTYPTTEWRPGDYIKDVYTGSIPSYQKAGKYRVNLGLYKSSKRMKVIDEPAAKEDSVPLGRVSLK